MSRWAIVLAGGEGSRIRPMIRSWLGAAVPKQYCTFCGTRSMLEHTLDRAAALVDAERIVTVIGKGHQRFHFSRPDRGRLIEQPESRDTAPGVFLPAAFIRSVDPSATVFILPSDQFVFPESGLTGLLNTAAEYAEGFGKMVLIGARPDKPETDYGWIEPGIRLSDLKGPALHGVKRFKEKPGRLEAGDWLRRGHLWNTMMMAAPLDLLWNLGRRHLPEIMIHFDRLADHLRGNRSAPSETTAYLRLLYSTLGSANFSRDLLELATESVAVLGLEGVCWCDWGRPERIVETLAGIGRSAAFQAVLPAPRRTSERLTA